MMIPNTEDMCQVIKKAHVAHYSSSKHHVVYFYDMEK